MTNATRRTLVLAGAGLAAAPLPRAFAQGAPYPEQDCQDHRGRGARWY